MKEITFEQLPNAVSQLSLMVERIERLLLEQSNQPSSESDVPLTIKQASAFTGLAVSTLYGYSHRGEIPVSKRGKRLFFLKSELKQWLIDGKKPLWESSESIDPYAMIKGRRR